MRFPELIDKAIWEKYVLRDEKGEPNPNTLHVGPFIDGMGKFLPEMFRIPFPTTYGPEHARQHLKGMLADTLPGDRARNLMTKDLKMTMRRSTWNVDPRSGRVPTVILNNRLRDAEPGDLLNSYQIQQNPETGDFEAMEQIHEDEFVKFDPKIREDKRFGLHYLLVGDEFSVSFFTRRGDSIELNFRLRPIGEGSSLLTPAQATDMVAW